MRERLTSADALAAASRFPARTPQQ
jgi:hypothetical protein